MGSRKVADLPQLIATVGVIAGLFFVAYEIRETNRIALAESVRSISTNFRELMTAQFATDIQALHVKAIERPDALSTAEIMELDSYLTVVIGNYQDWWRMNDLGFAERDGLDDLRVTADYYFASEFGRAWFEINEYWLWPEVAATIRHELETLPVRTVPRSQEFYAPHLAK